MKTFGFIMLRHVNNIETNKLWLHSYNCIRKYYPENIILIIDDNSNYNFITKNKLYKTVIINSELNGRGEFLFYYYYLKFQLFDIAFMLHDSVFINSYIKIDNNIDRYQILWDFEHEWDNIENETELINLFNDDELINFYNNKNLWKGCFGCMTIINYNFLKYINDKLNLNILIDYILNRDNRCALERVMGCILQYYNSNNGYCLFGNINNYIKWGITFEEKEEYIKLPLIKVWYGR